MRSQARTWIIAALVVATLISISIPFRYLASPMWQVWVVDETGAPIEGMTVCRVYQSYSTEAREHEDSQTTDNCGHATFAAQWSSATASQRRSHLGLLRCLGTPECNSDNRAEK